MNKKNGIYREWLVKADEDFNFAFVNLEDEREFFDQICFHFQQAGEKYLKAYIVAKKLDFRKIHELPTLLQICRDDDEEFTELEDSCIYLTEFYIDTRYPTYWQDRATKQHALRAKEEAKKIADFVKDKLQE